jgi:hypothetical protein
MKKIIPYIISYLIVFTGCAAFFGFTLHTASSPYFNFKLHTTLSLDELAAKLQQIGLSAPSVQLATVAYTPKFTSLISSFAFYAFVIAAFLGLAYLIERAISKPRP